MCHENYPSLILRTKIFVGLKTQESNSGTGGQSTRSGGGEAIPKMLSEGVAAYQDFESSGNLQRLERAISNFEAAVEMIPENDSRLPSISNYLGGLLLSRFEQLGRLTDINKSIELLRMAVSRTSDSSPSKPGFLNNLGSSLMARSRRLGNLADIDEAISQLQTSVNLTKDGHLDKPSFLNNLGSCHMARFERLGIVADVDSAITQHQAAVDLTPDGHPSKLARFNNLGTSLKARFERLGNVKDIDGAITQHQAALNLIPDGHPYHAGILNNLGNSFQTRFRQSADVADIDGAIVRQREAVSLTPDGHPDKSARLNDLGNSLQTRFQTVRDLKDLDDAILQYQAAINLMPDDHLDRASLLFNLGTVFQIHFLHFDQPPQAESAIHYLSMGAQSTIGSPTIRFNASERWISVASLVGHTSLLAAYECALGLMPLVAWLGLPIADRHEHLVRIGGIARDAAAAAISLEQYDKTLEWLEQGRSIVWTQILQLRTPVDELRSVDSDLAERLLQVSRLLDHGPEQRGGLRSTEEDGQRYRALTMEWESIIEQIRSLPKFEDFLKPSRVSKLMDAAQNGPVIVLNIAEKRCDALALVPGFEEVIHIPLSNVTSKKVIELRDEMKDLLYSSGMRTRGERAAKKVEDDDEVDDCGEILTELWNNLVKPVLDCLAFSVGCLSIVPSSLDNDHP
jgi:tetratricopeptide (TPR) repeat protein